MSSICNRRLSEPRHPDPTLQSTLTLNPGHAFTGVRGAAAVHAVPLGARALHEPGAHDRRVQLPPGVAKLRALFETGVHVMLHDLLLILTLTLTLTPTIA